MGSVIRTWAVGVLFVACSDPPGVMTGAAGAAGAVRGGSAGVAGAGGAAGRASAGAGGTAGAKAGAGGTAGAKAGAGGASAGAGGASAGAGGASAGAGGASAGAPAGEWAAACNGVTVLGHCAGEVYEWCDYFSRGLRRIDCGARGMTCRAEPRVLGSDFVNAGCFGGPCTEADEACDGTLASQCTPEGLALFDCAKARGPEATCGAGDGGRRSCLAVFCEPDQTIRCDGSVAVLCALDHNFGIVNCAEHTPGGTCEPQEDMSVLCDGQLIYP